MRKKVALLVLAVLLISMTASAMALITPKNPTNYAPAGNYALATSNISMNDGPGTKRFFKELGTYKVKGQYIKILAKAWDPNNDIWWFKVECPPDTGMIGWTGAKRFDASTYSLSDIPTEYWY